jgi:selenocysteine lyase/cysteine desulfurase
MGNFEHNSVRRPIERLADDGIIDYDVFDVRGRAETVVHRLEKLVRPSTRAIVCAHLSNICNIKAPIREIGEFCRRRGIAFIVDAAQSAGIVDIDLRKVRVDFLCIPGHKGLYGPQGCGIMMVSGRFPELKTLVEGGSGIHSLDPDMPSDLPERFEAGTLPTPAIAGLSEGITFVQSIGTRTIYEHECSMWRRLYCDMRSMKSVRVYEDTPGAILLFNVDGFSPAQIAAELNRAGICVRAGLHCAPLAHKTLGTGDNGAVRVSFGIMNTARETDRFADALYSIICS